MSVSQSRSGASATKRRRTRSSWTAGAGLLGRGWEQQKERGFSCMERLAPIPQAGTIANGKAISEAEVEAARWVRRVRSEGSTWDVLPQPTLSALYPNSSNRQDGPWHTAKMRIAEKLEDLTLLWQVGERGRRLGHKAGVYRWTDPACMPEKVGVSSDPGRGRQATDSIGPSSLSATSSKRDK